MGGEHITFPNGVESGYCPVSSEMAEVTQEMIVDYLLKKGGVVRNVDLVRHFRKFLQNGSISDKGRPHSYLASGCLLCGVYVLKESVRYTIARLAP